MVELTSEWVLQAVSRHLDWRRGTLAPEAVVRYLEKVEDRHGERFRRRHYMADLLWVSEANVVTEIEVKVSRSDWRADLTKGKWGRMPRWIARFVYAVPEELGVPGWVPAEAGVWHVATGSDGRPHVRVVRAPAVRSSEAVPARLVQAWRGEIYSRYWLRRLYEDSRFPTPSLRG